MAPPMRWPLALVAIVLLAGCAGPLRVEGDRILGYLELGAVDAAASYDVITQTASVEVVGSAQAEDVRDLRVEVYLVDRACAPAQGEPEEWIAREALELPDPEGNETIPWGTALSAQVLPGSEYALVAKLSGEGVIGPVFPACRSFRAA